ncbi:MAG: hypothetical protein WBV72_14275 [Nitrososphaeraceae archaeon]
MKNGKSIDYRISSFTLYSNRKLVIIISALIVLMVTDISLIRAYDIISKQLIPIDTRDILFGIISIVCLVAEYLLLELIKPPPGDERGKIRLHVILLYKVTKAVQYVIGAIVVFVILQILFSSYYNTAVLLAIILCSYTLSIGILSVFISRILTLRRNTIFTFLFVLALGSITINAAIAVVDVSLRLGDRPPETRAFFGGSSDISKGKYNTMDESYFISYIISFVSAWIATAILLSNYYRKLGKIKYLFITISPMVFFIGQFAAFFTNEISSIINVDQFFLASLTTFITTLSKPLGGLMLGIAFWSMSRMGKSHTALNKYLIISGFGFFLLFTSNQAILMSIAPYPPFGIATITVMGLSAYLVVVGIYMSTISLSQDTQLRRSIRRVAITQSKLFDSMVTAEIEIEIERRVREVINIQSVEMEDETGVQPSLNEQEAHDYLKEVIREIKK